MPKRTSDVAELSGGKTRAAAKDDVEMGEFEDRWEDELEEESEGEVVDAEAEDGEEDGECCVPLQGSC